MKKFASFLILLSVSLSLAAQQATPGKEFKKESDGFEWYLVTAKDGTKSALDKNGKTLVPAKKGYTSIVCYSDAFSVQKNGFSGLYSRSGKELMSTDRGYTYCSYDGGKFICVSKNGNYGACNMGGKEIIPTDRGYTFVMYNEYGNYFSVTNKNGRGLCDVNGKEIVSPNRGYDYVSTYPDDDYIKVGKNEKEGICDKNGKELISPDRGYDSIMQNTKGYTVKKKGKEGLCSIDGKEMFSPELGYDSVNYNKDKKCFEVVKNGGRGVCDLYGEEIVPTSAGYTSILVSDDYILAEKNGIRTKINKDGSMSESVTPENKVESDGFKWTLLKRSDGKVAGRNNDGRMIFSFDNYSKVIYNPKYKVFELWRNGNTGLTTAGGKSIVRPLASIADYSFENGLWKIKNKSGVYAVYGENGSIISDANGYTSVKVCGDGLIWCGKETVKKTYDKGGKVVSDDWVDAEQLAEARRRAEQAEAQRLQNIANALNAAAQAIGSTSAGSTGNTAGEYATSGSSAGNGTLVGMVSALGLSRGLTGSGVVTHSQSFQVYKDSNGYYIIDPKTHLSNYLSRNGDRTFLDYPVGQYNYKTLTTLGSDIHWFFSL